MYLLSFLMLLVSYLSQDFATGSFRQSNFTMQNSNDDFGLDLISSDNRFKKGIFFTSYIRNTVTIFWFS